MSHLEYNTIFSWPSAFNDPFMSIFICSYPPRLLFRAQDTLSVLLVLKSSNPIPNARLYIMSKWALRTLSQQHIPNWPQHRCSSARSSLCVLALMPCNTPSTPGCLYLGSLSIQYQEWHCKKKGHILCLSIPPSLSLGFQW